MKTVRVSASQVQLALLCWRKWAFAYILGLREPETRALALGTLVHAILEAYLRHGTVPDPTSTWNYRAQLVDLIAAVKPDSKEHSKLMAAWGAGGKDDTRNFYPGKIALSMMPAGVLPAPGVGEVEHHFEFTDAGVVWNGFIDSLVYDATVPGTNFADMPGHAESGLIINTDHKSSSDPRKWGKLGDDESDHADYESRQLHRDVQSIIYARAMIERFGPANVLSQWNYGAQDASPSKARVATARYTPGDVYALFENVVAPVGKEIRRLRLMNADPLSLPASPDACHAYHKLCPHSAKCNLTTKDKIGSLIMGTSTIDSLLAEANAAAAAPAAAAPAAMPEPAPGATVNPPEADAGAAPAQPAVPLGGAPTPAATAAPAAAPTKPTPPVGAAAPASTGEAGAAMASTKRGASKRKAKAPAVPAGDGGLGTVLAQLAEIRAVDDELADAVAAKLADKLAEKLIAGLG